MLYHASSTPGIRLLEPRISNHGTPLVYLSRKRENVLVYLSNAIERFCRSSGFSHTGPWCKWGPYGFGRDGLIRLEEYYPNALEETYAGVSGYIYHCADVPDSGETIQIPDAVTSRQPVDVLDCELVPDALEAILRAEAAGLLHIHRYAQLTQPELDWIRRTMTEEYQTAAPDYRHFITAKFGIGE